MNKKILIIALISISVLGVACGDKKTKDLNTQAVKPPVESNTQTKTDKEVKPDTKQDTDTTTDTDEKDTTKTDTESSNSGSDAKTTSTKNDNSLSSTSISYELVKAVYNNENVTINYPQITNLIDKDKQKLINDVLKNEALKVLNYYKDSTGDVTLDINYIIKYKGNDQLSVQYSGIAYVKGVAHPNNLFYTTNIDLNKAVKLRLSDLAQIDEDFINKFKSSVDKSDQPGKLSVQQYTTANLVKMFNNSDSLDNIGTVNQSDIFSYITKDTIGISVSVSYAEGGHVEFEIKK